jgi:mono/diheme cytochrome c family protein
MRVPPLGCTCALLVDLVAGSGCHAVNDAVASDPAATTCAGYHTATLPDDPQHGGDPQAGFTALLNGSYMSCGVPLALWQNPLVGPTLQASLGSDGAIGLAGRQGVNATLPSSLVAFTTTDGAQVINLSCLKCHGGRFDGEYIIGLGNATADFTGGLTGGLLATQLPDSLLSALGLTPAELASLEKMLRTARAVGPDTVMRTVGNNPAEVLTGALFRHHDPITLSWSDSDLISSVIHDEHGQAIAHPTVTSDPPPWWRVKKKRALFYNGMARGQHRGTEEIATLACVDDLDEARRVDAIFRDIQAYLGTITAPRYPRAVDGALAAEGKRLFVANCSCCHGSYADDPADDAHDSYPNVIVPLTEIGTDPVVAKAGSYAPQYKAWYEMSYYATVSPAVTDDPFEGYVAPPLDGIWATAPYLHNGSVPTVELVLDSKARPAAWRRVDLDDTHFDERALGWPWQLAPPQASAPAADQKLIYDTTIWGQSNAGHTFGDHLSDDERRAVIEYLKTL